MAILHPGHDLLEKVPGLGLGQAPLFDDIVEELPGADVLHHDVDVRGGVDDLVEADDVRVGEEAQDLDLAAD